MDALERTLDAVLPPAREPTVRDDDSLPPPPPVPGSRIVDRPDAETTVTPPPPPAASRGTGDTLPGVEIEPPALDLPAPSGDAHELDTLRRQAASLQKQLDLLRQRIDQLEKAQATPPPPPAPGGNSGQ